MINDFCKWSLLDFCSFFTKEIDRGAFQKPQNEFIKKIVLDKSPKTLYNMKVLRGYVR